MGINSGCPDTELLIRYVSGGLTDDERLYAVTHLASCSCCREEVAWLLSLKEAMQAEAVPASVTRTAFDLLPDGQSELDRILAEGSLSLPFDLLAYVYGAIRDTMTLAHKAGALAAAAGV
jgi:hypothetical protein